MKTKQQEGQLGLFRPETDWVAPSELPDLRDRDIIAIDTENKDEGLANGRGPGWALGPWGYICGVSYAAKGASGYIPINHPETEECFPKENVMRWLDDHFRSSARIVMHNGPYDIGWLGAPGYDLSPPENLEDTLAACVMVDENERSYSLENCCARAGIPGKDERLLGDAVEAYGGSRKKTKANLWRLPARFVGGYAEQDAVATLGLWHQTEPALIAQDLMDAYRTEMGLIPMVVAMRRRGIRVNASTMQQSARDFREVQARALKQIGEILELRRPVTIDELRTNKKMDQWFAAHHINVPRTAGGKMGSFSKDWMERHTHPLPRAVTLAFKMEDAATKFVENFILGFSHRGRIHSEVHQFKSDEGGTRSQRFSYSEPPLQQMPTPDKDPRDDAKNLIEDLAVGTKIRRGFEPEKGTGWLAADYSQQEPRLTVHFASVCKARGAEAAVERYRENARTDYHTMVAEMTGRPRPIAKILNLGMTYGKGKRSLADELGVDLEAAEGILKDYHERLPFIKSLEDICKSRSSARGFIRLIDGARMHYPLWEGGWIDWDVRKDAEARGKRLEPTDLDTARQRQADPEHPWSRTRLRRADTRKSLNNLVQGSAARQTKRAMLAMWREGFLPLLQMHDEVDVPVSSKAEVTRIGDIMVETTPLVVPTVVDLEVGPTWGEAKMTFEDFAAKYLRAA